MAAESADRTPEREGFLVHADDLVAPSTQAPSTQSLDDESSAKRQIERIVRELPDDSSFDDILRELTFHRMLARGLGDADAGRTIAHADVLRRSRTWIR